MRRIAVVTLALLAGGAGAAQEPEKQPARLSALASEPDWTNLEKFQGTMGRADFTRLLDTVYAPGGAWKYTIRMGDDGARVLTTGTNELLLRFADEGKGKAAPEYWRPLAGHLPDPTLLPNSEVGGGKIEYQSKLHLSGTGLAGVKIALDPGHLGGPWAKMEERWFQVGAGTIPVAEGDMTLLTARLLAAKLRKMGADVALVRNDSEPATKLRPGDLVDAAREQLKRQGMRFTRDKYNGPEDLLRMNSVQWTSELLFYRTAEIQARARRVNEVLQPDLVLCLHYNAEGWGDPKNPQLVAKNHMHILVNGSYSASELALDDVRYSMLVKLLSRCYEEELPVAEHVADSMPAATGLPPYQYVTPNAIRVGPNPYVWARDLLANRLYQCPVVYIEPYVMNSQEVWDRVQAGNYTGRKLIDGKPRENIYQEYATAVAQGLDKAAQDLRK